jgi:hypothetical protein
MTEAGTSGGGGGSDAQGDCGVNTPNSLPAPLPTQGDAAACPRAIG